MMPTAGPPPGGCAACGHAPSPPSSPGAPPKPPAEKPTCHNCGSFAGELTTVAPRNVFLPPSSLTARPTRPRPSQPALPRPAPFRPVPPRPTPSRPRSAPPFPAPHRRDRDRVGLAALRPRHWRGRLRPRVEGRVGRHARRRQGVLRGGGGRGQRGRGRPAGRPPRICARGARARGPAPPQHRAALRRQPPAGRPPGHRAQAGRGRRTRPRHPRT